MSSGVLTKSGVQITQEIEEWHTIATQYNIAPQEVGLIDFNRTGVRLDDEDVRIGFRTRFNGSVLYGNDLSWFALPVRSEDDTNFHIRNGKIYFGSHQIGFVDKPVLDTCDTSYQRGRRLLNLNSRSRSNCAGCKACVHNDKKLYDSTVIKDRHELETRQDIEQFFKAKERLGVRIGELDQIAVVTGLFASEDDALSHMQDVYEVASSHGFSGELMYFGCQIIQQSAIREFSKLGKTAIVFAIDNFTERGRKLSPVKSKFDLGTFYDAMFFAKAYGIETTFAYIAGVDELAAIEENFGVFVNVCSRFPVINIFQIQTQLQAQAMSPEAKTLDYYVKVRSIVESIFKNTGMRPRRWENYRPLWYRTFNNELLDVRPYG